MSKNLSKASIFLNLSYTPSKLFLLLVICSLVFTSLQAQDGRHWLSAGQNLSNTRHAANENKISAGNAGNLAKKWVFTTAGDVSATPAVDGQSVYFPDWAGYLYKVDAATGALQWKKEIKGYTGQTSGLARATPAISGNTLVIGAQLGNPTIGGHVLGINKNTGALLWKTKVDDHPAAIVTQSAVIHGNKAYVGVASMEEAFAANPFYPCCSFRGSLVCLDITTGQIVWKTYMVPNTPAATGDKAFSGNAVWGSTPVIDVKRNSVYITTGNNYTVPQAVLDCNVPGKTPAEVRACVMAVPGSAENLFDAIVSLDLNTGAIKWARSVIPFDAWTVACFFDGPNCPENAGPDYDFGQGAALFTVGTGANKRELLGAGQKSGIYWAVDPATGAEVWKTQVGPGGTLGGLQWGSAVDGNRIYTAIANNGFTEHTMTKGPGAGQKVKGGFWAALDAATGAVIWEYAATNPPTAGFFGPPGSVAVNTGMVTSANGVVFAGAMDAEGTMYAINAATGEKLWSFLSGGSISSGAAVVNGTVYWGSGYTNFGLGTPNNKLYAFHLPEENAITSRPKSIESLPAEGATGRGAISVYPSPAKDKMKVVSNDNSNIRSIQLFDLSGKLVKEIRPSGSPTYNLDLSALPAGTYMVYVSTTTMNKSAKLVLVH
jgi:polyvinyl alcohol dehydrogenase (cytochrome)